jgi:hypothetical protein
LRVAVSGAGNGFFPKAWIDITRVTPRPESCDRTHALGFLDPDLPARKPKKAVARPLRSEHA